MRFRIYDARLKRGYEHVLDDDWDGRMDAKVR